MSQGVEQSTFRRADAERNRKRLLDVARAAIAEQGTGVSLRRIARDAGVGFGTLYRHFPTRDELLRQVLQDGFDEVAELEPALSSCNNPLDALTAWLDAVAAHTAALHGLADSIVDQLRSPSSPLHQACASLNRTTEALLTRAQAAHLLRADVDAGDLTSLVAAIAWVADRESLSAEKRRRLLGLMMEGLQT